MTVTGTVCTVSPGWKVERARRGEVVRAGHGRAVGGGVVDGDDLIAAAPAVEP